MSRNAQKPAAEKAAAPTKLPGDHLSSSEQRRAQESTISQIRSELDAERQRNEAFDRQKASELAGSDIKLAQMEETIEDRAASFDASISLIIAEMEAQNVENPPRTASAGLDDASLDMIKAELAKTHKRVVLPSG